MAIFSRVLASIIGGYWLANVISIILVAVLAGEQVDRVLTGMLASFAIWSAAIVWVFSVDTVRKAWVGVLVPAVTGSIIIFTLLKGSL